jgi:tight adherence protein C
MPGYLLLAAAALLVGLGLAGLTVAALRPRDAVSGVARSLEILTGTGAPRAPMPIGELSARERLWSPLVGSLLAAGRRLTPIGTPERLRRRLDLAGNPEWLDVDAMIAIKAGATFVALGLGAAVLVLTRSVSGLVLAVALVAVGYWLPDVLLHRAGATRQDAVRAAAPDAIDMLTICVEAGLGFDAALSQVARNTTGPVAADFARLLREMQLGRSRVAAFGDFAARTTAPEIKAFVSALIQADRLGVPVASVLREQSAQMRVRRRQRAEEAAMKVPVKIIFPVLFCIFPAFFVIVIGPGAIRIAEAFGG